jgi:hypothetical protein
MLFPFADSCCGRDDALGLQCNQAVWLQCVKHGSVGDSWPVAFSVLRGGRCLISAGQQVYALRYREEWRAKIAEPIGPIRAARWWL